MQHEDTGIIGLLIEKDQRGLEIIMGNYTNCIYSLVGNILGSIASKEDIEECTSDVFVNAWLTAAEYRPEKGSLKTWLLIKAKYAALDFRRKINKKKNIIEKYNININSTDENVVEQSVINKEYGKNIRNAINKLNKKDRQIFLRRYYMYQDIDDIAKKMNLSRYAVDNRLYRTRQKLKKILKSELKPRYEKEG